MAAFPWFRLYSEILTDRKLTRACRATGQPRATVIGVWTVLLAMASSSPQRGVLLVSEGNPIQAWEIQEDTGLSPDAIDPILAEFSALGMIHQDNGATVITNWVKRNFESDVSRERTRQYRERHRNVTEPSRKQFGDVLDTDTDTDTDTERDTEESICPGATAPERKPAPKRPREPLPPAVEVFRHEMGRNPARQMYGDIQAIVGEKPDDLQFWSRVIHGWVARGYNPKNISGMLQFYRRRELPTDGRSGTGHSDPIADYQALAAKEGWTDGNQT